MFRRCLGRHSDGPVLPAQFAWEQSRFGSKCRRGNDILRGDDGADTFFFDTALDPATNVDTILGFEHKIDTIALSLTIFTGISGAAGDTLSKAQFYAGKKAHDKSDRIIYNEKNGKLFSDDNGNHKGHKELIAILDKHLHISHGDFDLVA